jgi:LmbE family N-acetylglucosaminyl deacetylase
VFFDFSRPLIFVAHPDDETLACGGLVQRMASSLVVFATDGAPPDHGFERKFGTLKRYSETRFQEAALALAQVPNCSFQRLTKPDGTYFVDEQLFHNLPQALASLCRIARCFSPDALLSHAYEGGHIDHDACSFLAMHAAAALALPRFEFPLYSRNQNGQLVLQQFCDASSAPAEWHLTETEVLCKQKMIAAYASQRGLASAFHFSTERIRPATRTDFSIAACRDYSYRNRWQRLWRKGLSASALLRNFRKFEVRQDSPGAPPA